jgi:hypothetical protein
VRDRGGVGGGEEKSFIIQNQDFNKADTTITESVPTVSTNNLSLEIILACSVLVTKHFRCVRKLHSLVRSHYVILQILDCGCLKRRRKPSMSGNWQQQNMEICKRLPSQQTCHY